jgi:hypothetical protein
MNLPLPAPQVPEAQIPVVPPSAPQRSWPRILVNVLVALVVLAVAAAAFVLSYSGVHAVAIAGGVSVRLARVYPALFDAVLVIACVAAVMLSGGRWWARCWAWLVIIIVLAAIGATDVAHAANYALPHRQMQGVVAAAPVVAVLLAFSLLITLLRNSRTRPLSAEPSRADGRRAAKQQAAVASVLKPRPLAPPIALPAATTALPAPAEPEPTTDVPEADQPHDVEDVEAEEVAASAPETTATAAQTPNAAPVMADVPPAADVTPPTDVAARSADAETDSADVRPGQAPEPTSGDDSSADDYWEPNVDARLAGQVYPVEPTDFRRPLPPELDDDAPPFATAPFASIPRLNRVRATPTPPADADKDEDADS